MQSEVWSFRAGFLQGGLKEALKELKPGGPIGG